MSGTHEVFPVSRTSYLHGWWRRFTYPPGWLVNMYVRLGDTVLDIGIGTGPGSERYARAGLRVYGMDISDDMLEICRKKNFAAGLGCHD